MYSSAPIGYPFLKDQNALLRSAITASFRRPAVSFRAAAKEAGWPFVL